MLSAANIIYKIAASFPALTATGFLCDLCVICERITRKSTQVIAQLKTQCLSQISQIYADKTQNHNNIPTCLSLRYNAALLHSSASSAGSAGEYSRKSTQTIYTEETQCLPQISQIYADKTQNNTNYKLSFSAK